MNRVSGVTDLFALSKSEATDQPVTLEIRLAERSEVRQCAGRGVPPFGASRAVSGLRRTVVRALGGVIPYPGLGRTMSPSGNRARSPVDQWQNLGRKTFELVRLVSNWPDEDLLDACRSEGVELLREPLGRADRQAVSE